MAYPLLDTVNATTDPTELLIYVNDLTFGLAMPLMLLSFFTIILLGGMFMQIRRGTVRPEVLLASSGFATFGLAMMMSLREGLLNPIYVFLSLGISILGVVWMFLSSAD